MRIRTQLQNRRTQTHRPRLGNHMHNHLAIERDDEVLMRPETRVANVESLDWRRWARDGDRYLWEMRRGAAAGSLSVATAGCVGIGRRWRRCLALFFEGCLPGFG